MKKSSVLEEVKARISLAKQNKQPFSIRQIVWTVESERYQSLMGISPNYYHQLRKNKNMQNLRYIYDKRAVALASLFNTTEHKNTDNLRILATHHLACAKLLKRFRKHVLERW